MERYRGITGEIKGVDHANQEGRYIYCVAPLTDLSTKGLRGLEETEVYQLVFRDIGAVVHDCPAVPYQGDDEKVKAWLLAHHNVIDTVWNLTGTVLPMTFDIIIKGDARNSANDNVLRWLEENYMTFKEKLVRLQGKVELSIQVIWDRTTALEQVASADPEVKRLQGEMEGKPKGMSFFYQQKIQKHLKKRVEEIADNIYRQYLKGLQALAVETHINKPKRLEQKEMLLNLSLLAERDRIKEIGDLLGELQEQQGIEVRFTGPWPPYSFVTTMPLAQKVN